MGRARDDLDMERALRPRINAPDVVRSTLSHKELKYNESTIDQLLGTPNKIIIPERYVPEKVNVYSNNKYNAIFFIIFPII
jgi:lambda repressor-like predicted transcriptional regulator